MKLWLGLLVGVVVGTAGGFMMGKSKGNPEGYESANKAYYSWAISMMHRDPNLRLDAIMLAPNGARIRVPKCDSDESLYGVPHRIPEVKYHESANLKLENDVLLLTIPTEGENTDAWAGVVVGCRKKNEIKITDLTKSWELPSTMR